MPLVVINSGTLNVVRAGPEGRRRFIDSFVFHVEQSFAQTSRRYMHALKQRNALLRERRGVDDSVWVRDLAEAGEFLVSSRARAVAALSNALMDVLVDMQVSLPEWQLVRCGWAEGRSLADALASAAAGDRQRGFTQVGPHRGDVIFLVEGSPAHEVLSRGQMKVLMAATACAGAGNAARDRGFSCAAG